MKKRVLFFMLLALGTLTASAQATYLRGDVNGDEKTNITDVSELIRKLKTYKKLDIRYDVDLSGTVDKSDVDYLKTMIMSKTAPETLNYPTQTAANEALSDGLEIRWDENDAFALYNQTTGDTEYQYTLTSEANTTSATFTGMALRSSWGYFAYYPYYTNMQYWNKVSIGQKSGRIDVDDLHLTTQYARKGNIPAGIPRVAYVDVSGGDANLTFKNVYAFIKLTTTNKCRSITFTPNNADEDSKEFLAPSSPSIVFDSNGNPQIVSSTYESDPSVTLVDKDGGTIAAGTYYVAVRPQTLSKGFTVKCVAAFDPDNVAAKEISDKIVLKRNNVYDAGSINLSQLLSLDGEGTFESPYKIYDYDDLQTMRIWINNDNSGRASRYYLQVKDIDCEGKVLTPIGNTDHYFKGIYEGAHHTIKNFKLDCLKFGTYVHVYALFGIIKNATIWNLTIDHPRINGSVSGETDYVSPLVGLALSQSGTNSIAGCHAIDTSGETWSMGTCTRLVYGGIVASNESKLDVSLCSNEINMDVKRQDSKEGPYVGGIVGYTVGENYEAGEGSELENSTVTRITKCRNTGSFSIDENGSTGSKTALGGILGLAEDFTLDDDVTCVIISCVNTGALTTTNAPEQGRDDYFRYYIGGIVGSMDSDGSNSTDPKNPLIANCINRGKIKTDSKYSTTGILGYESSKAIHLSYCVNCTEVYYALYNQDASLTSSAPTCTHCYTTTTCSDMSGCVDKEAKTVTPGDMNDLIKDLGDNYATWKLDDDDNLDLDF